MRRGMKLFRLFMRRKPTRASVTSKQCRCGYLQFAAEESGNPIVFDEVAGEYQFTYQEPGAEGPSLLVLYHCPFCGGAAPQSKRANLFHVIPKGEVRRLTE